jgi:alkanesulfonate monooxygenase SsuD/methylene tetrahydromethanopterin reductase-like flavin-dependent oxidoreductase (luciferase family)
VGLTPMETRRDVIVRTAMLADELGYETFGLPEGWGLDAGPVLAEIALRTSRVRLVSSIFSIWGRTPATLAMTAATLDQLSGGRFVLGLGASTKALTEGFHGVAFDHPAARLRTVVTQVRALLSGQPAQLGPDAGAEADARPLRLGQPAVPGLPIWVAALGPRTLRVAAELGDGWIPALVARDRLPGRAAELARHRQAARPGPPLTVAAGPLAVADEDPGTARAIAATGVAWYLSAMGDVYARSVSGQGYAPEVDAIIAANPRPSPRHGLVPPEAQGLLDQLAVYGPAGQVREQLAAWDTAADVVALMLPPGLPWPAIEATLRAAAPGTRPPSHGRHRDSTHPPYPLPGVPTGAKRAWPAEATEGGHGAAGVPAGLRGRAPAESTQ